MKRGIVIGKFYPPHLGHSYLIQTALDACDELTVLVCDSASYGIPATLRAEWLQKIHPSANVVIIPDIGDDDDSKAWAAYTINFLGYTPDVVFSSEDYGPVWAKYMGSQHVMVDKKREHVPISATKIRSNPLKYWEFMHPYVRGYYAKRVCIVGAESTGTTMLSKELAKHYNTTWVPEYGRLYSEAKMYSHTPWYSDEFNEIAKTQQKMETQLAGYSSGLLICDTNATATELWHERYMGDRSDEVHTIAEGDSPLCYIITGDEIPFEQDGLRDGEHIRHDMHQQFIQKIISTGVPYRIVSGTKLHRLRTSVAFIQNQLTKETP